MDRKSWSKSVSMYKHTRTPPWSQTRIQPSLPGCEILVRKYIITMMQLAHTLKRYKGERERGGGGVNILADLPSKVSGISTAVNAYSTVGSRRRGGGGGDRQAQAGSFLLLLDSSQSRSYFSIRL